jgi:hypothetical protein
MATCVAMHAPAAAIVGISVTLLAQAVLLDGTALAAPGECRFIQSRKERNACYDREAAARAAAKAAAQKSARTKMSDTIDQMKIENDRLSRRLQGICRGC